MTIWQGVILNGTEVVNAPTIVGSTIFDTNDQTITFGHALAAASTRLSQDTTRAQFLLGLGTALGLQFIIGHNSWIGHDYDHAAPANPTLFIHSAVDPDVNNTQWVSLAHDQTNAVLTAGTGIVNIPVNAAVGYDADPALLLIGRPGASEPNGALGAYFDAAISPAAYFGSNTWLDPITSLWQHGSAAHNSVLWLAQNGTQYWFSRPAGVGVPPGTAKMAMALSGGFSIGNSAAYVDAGLGGLVLDASIQFSNVTANFAKIVQNTTTDELKLGVGSEHGRQFIICESAHVAHDFDHALVVDPTLFIHSATDPDVNNTQWLSLSHNQTNGVIEVGKGKLSLNGFGGANGFVCVGSAASVAGLVASNDLLVSGKFEVIDAAYANASLNCPKINYTTAAGSNYAGNFIYADDGLQLWLSMANNTTNGNFILTTSTNAEQNHGHSTPSTNPTLFIHSVTDVGTSTAQWISFSHNVTDGVISTGTGDIVLNPVTEITEVCGVGLKTKEYNATLNDDATISLPVGTGWGTFMIGDNQEYARVRWTAAAVVTLDEGTANVAIADTDNNFCIYDGGATVTVKNRLGANLTVRYVIHYS